MQVAAIVLCAQKVSGRQEAQRLPARHVVWARRRLVALPALLPVSVILEGAARPVACVPSGTYSPGGSTAPCTSCPAGTTTVSTGNDDPSRLCLPARVRLLVPSCLVRRLFCPCCT